MQDALVNSLAERQNCY